MLFAVTWFVSLGHVGSGNQRVFRQSWSVPLDLAIAEVQKKEPHFCMGLGGVHPIAPRGTFGEALKFRNVVNPR